MRSMFQLSDKADSAHLPENLPKNRTNIVASMSLPFLYSLISASFVAFIFTLNLITSFNINSILMFCFVYFLISLTVKSFECLVAQFSRYSWPVLAHEFTSSTKTYNKKNSFRTEIEKPTHPQNCIPTNKQRSKEKTPTFHVNWSARYQMITQYF